LTKKETGGKQNWYLNPLVLGVILLSATILLNIIFF